MLRPHLYYPNVNVGRKGSVVFYVRGEVVCMRSYTKPKDPKTPSQKAQRSLHASLTRISGQTKEFRRFCYDGLDSYRSSHTAFIGLQMCQMSRRRESLDWPLESRIRWGRGSLPGTHKMAFDWKEKPVLSWQCDKRKLTRQTDPDNRALWIVWNASRDGWRWSLEGGKRRDEACGLGLPQEWKGDELYVWLLFYDPLKRRFSNDTCLHVKAGEVQSSCRKEGLSLFPDQGFLFDTLVEHWNSYRKLRGWDQRKYWEKWFG